MFQQRRPAIPFADLGQFHHVIAIQRAHRNKFHVTKRAELWQKILNLVADFQKPFLAPIHQVHFVDGDDEVRDAEQRGDVSVAACLLDDARARVHQHDGEVRRRSARNHVARVLDVTWRVGDDELAARRSKITISNVNRDTLLSFCAQTVGEIRQIDLSAAGDVRAAFKRLDLIFHQRL